MTETVKHEQIGRPECPYIERWMLDLGVFSVRLHHWYRSDDKRSPHDHPWWFVTLVLKGKYEDWNYKLDPEGKPDLNNRRIDLLSPGSIRYRSSHHVHSVSILPGGCWTLLITGRKERTWGFWVKRAIDGLPKFKKSNKYFLEHGHPACDDF